MTSSGEWREQFERVKRWYERFKIIDSGRPHTHPSDYYQDEVYAFFQNCHHLRDWILNDDNINIGAQTLKNFVTGHQELQICGDLCNGTKHLKLKKPWSTIKPEFGARHFDLKLEVPNNKATISVKYSIDTDTGEMDAFELATKCLQSWEWFIKSNINDEAST